MGIHMVDEGLGILVIVGIHTVDEEERVRKRDLSYLGVRELSHAGELSDVELVQDDRQGVLIASC